MDIAFDATPTPFRSHVCLSRLEDSPVLSHDIGYRSKSDDLQEGLGVLIEPILRNRGEDIIVRGLTGLGHFTLLLGVAFVAPGWSQADGLAQRQTTASAIATEGQTTERNWHAFWRYHLGTWQGRWTRYAASGDVKETFTSTRQFTAKEAKTDIVQVNLPKNAVLVAG